MLYLLGYAGQGQLRIFGKSNEKYHVRGGNDQIVERASPTRSHGPDHDAARELVAIKRNADGTLHADASGRAARRRRSPPTRSCSRCRSRSCASVDYSQGRVLAASRRRRSASWGWARTPSSTSQFTSRHWHALGSNGDTFADTGYQSTWEVTRAPAGHGRDPRRLHRRQRSAPASAAARRRAARSSSWRRSSRCCRDHRAVERPRDARLLAG